MGVHELAVTEVIYRLVRPGAITVDLGANLGYDTTLLARRAGPTGTVHAYEPHPEVFARLKRNVGHLPTVVLHQQAVADYQGQGALAEAADFETNTGGSHLGSAGFPVAVTTLDAALSDAPIGLIKIDIEGHELAALAGGARTISQTEHIVFEEYDAMPTPVSRRLEDAGFTLHGIAETLRGPKLVEPSDFRENHWDAPTFLATRDPEIRSAIRPDGWWCLRSKSLSPA